MCTVHAMCPNCGQPELDADERSCITLDGVAYREYHCHACKALIQVRAHVDLPAPSRRIVDVPLPS